MRNTNLLKQPIFLFPWTAEAVLMYHVLKKNGYTVSGICDNNDQLHGKTYEGCPIIKPVSGKDETVIICGHRLYIHGHIFDKFLKIDQLLTDDDVQPAIDSINTEEFLALAPKQTTKLGRLKHEIRQVILPKDNIVLLNTINITVTERCNLRCKHCAALMQYFERPVHIPIEELKHDIDALLSKVDFIRDIHILGGEPFLYPQLSEYLTYLRKYRSNIGSLYLITNGTVVPKQEVIDALAESEVLVRISDYKEKSWQKEALIKALDVNGVMSQVTDYPWTYENQLVYDDTRTPQQKFDCCFAKRFNNCLTNGKIYYCDFLANAEKLEMVPYDADNGITLDGASGADIISYLQKSDAPLGCTYCGGHDHSIEIPIAEQTPDILPYRSFKDTYEK